MKSKELSTGKGQAPAQQVAPPDQRARPATVQRAAQGALPRGEVAPSPARASQMVARPAMGSAPGRARMANGVQRAAGNAYLERTAGENGHGATPGAPGGGSGAGAPPNPPRAQAKLTVNAPGDSYEQEADRVANTVARGAEPKPGDAGRISRIGPVSRLQRSARDEAGSALAEVPDGGLRGLIQSPGTGSPLPPGLRDEMEGSFREDFSGVRVHTGGQVNRVVKEINANAFTFGQDIYLDEGKYKPGTQAGDKLLAHELTHTIQQRGSGNVQASLVEAARISQPGEPLEREAEQAADQATANASAKQRSPDRPVAAQPPVITLSVTRAPSGAQIQRLGETLGKWLSDWDPVNLRPYTVYSVIKDDDPSKVSRLSESQLKVASPDEKIKLIKLIHRLTWVGPNDEYRLEFIWNSFGAILPAIAEKNLDLWKESINYGAELEDISVVRDLKTRFEEDVRAKAREYLQKNRGLVDHEKKRLGLDNPNATMTEEQQAATAEVQKAAAKVRDALAVMDRLREIPVGFRDQDPPPEGLSQPRYPEAKFDPEKPPKYRTSPAHDPLPVTWQQVKVQYDRLATLVAGQANKHPSIYAMVQRGSREDIRKTADLSPKEARGIVSKVLLDVEEKMKSTGEKLRPGGDIDFYDLLPIHKQFKEGMAAASGAPWSNDFMQWVAEDDLSHHEAREFWISIGLATLAAAAFIVAEFATLGSATFFIAAGVGLIASGYQATRSWQQYLSLAEAAEANVSDEFALISSGQANEALLEAVINTVAFFADAYGPVSRGLRVGATAAESAAAKAAAKKAFEAEGKKVTQMAAKEAAEKSTATQLAEGAAKRAALKGLRGVTELLGDLFREFVEAVRMWGQKVFAKFRFKSYEVVQEGEYLVLYGIRSRVPLARIRIKEVEEWIINNSDDIEAARHSRASQLGKSRSAKGAGNDAMANLLRQNAVKLSEKIGEESAKSVILTRFPSAVLIHQGSGSRTLDLVFRLSSGEIIVVEAKGGGGKIIARTSGATQGTVAYLREVIDDMRRAGMKEADEILEALDNRRLRYFLTETPVPRGTEELETTLSEFLIPKK